MYQNIFFDRRNNTIHLWDDSNGYVNFEYKPYAYKKKVGGDYKSIFGDELEKVHDFNDRYTAGLFESDVLAETRTLIDLYGDDDNVSTNHVVLNYDIEVAIEGGFAPPDDPWQEITSVAFKDSKSKIRRVYVLDVDNVVSDSNYTDDIGEVDVKRFDSEEDLLTTFMDEYQKINPSIITGWNIDSFDNPYLYNRLKRVFGQGVAKKLSPIGIAYCSPKRNDGSFVTTIAGVSCLDYLKLFKTFTYKEYPNYRLGTIGMLEVKMDKIEYDGNLNDLFKEDINKFIQYNLTDVDIVDAIDNKNKLIDLAMTICHICHVPYEFIEYSSKYLEGGLLTYLRRKNLVAPNKPPRKQKNEDDEDVGFAGAYVKSPIPGAYEWVFDLDLTSLYPSIIMSLNISPETLKGKVFSHIEPAAPKEGGKKNEMIPAHPSWSPENFCSNKLTKIFLTEEDCWNDSEVGESSGVMSLEDFKKTIETNNLSIASNGALYTQDKVGLLGEVLDTWFKQRVEFRKLEKQYGKEGNDELYKFYNKRQKVQKILLNSLYGVLGLSIFRFYDLTNAEAVTLTGQTIIKTSAKMGNQYYNSVLETEDIDYCVYTDTDSTFFSAKPIIKKTMPDVNLNDKVEMTEATRKVADTVQRVLNTGYNSMSKRMFNIEKHRFDIKQELVSKRAIWIKKKRYVQWIVDEVGIPKDELDIKGLDVVRSSFPVKFRDFMYIDGEDADGNKLESGILVDFIKEASKAEVDEKILKFRREVGTYPVEEVSRNTSVKNISKYEKEVKNEPMGHFPRVIKDGKTLTFPAHVKSAISFNKFLKHHGLDKDVEPITNGEKIKYVYLRQNEFGLEELAFRGYRDPKIVMDFINKYADGRGLYQKEMAKKLDDFYDALKWDYPSEGDKILGEYFSVDDCDENVTIRKTKNSKSKVKVKNDGDGLDQFFSF